MPCGVVRQPSACPIQCRENENRAHFTALEVEPEFDEVGNN